MRGFERGRIIHAVAGHGDDFAVGLQGLDNAQLLLGHDAREHASCPCASGQFGIIKMFDYIAGQNLGRVEPRLLRDSARGRGVIARDHHDPDSRGAAFPHGFRDARPQRIGKADQAEKHKRKVTLRFRPGLTLV